MRSRSVRQRSRSPVDSYRPFQRSSISVCQHLIQWSLTAPFSMSAFQLLSIFP